MSDSTPTSPELSASAGMKMISREQRQRALEIAMINEDRAKACSRPQSELAQTFRLSAAFLREIAE
ncbi:MAG TPA: hypothetical protein VGD45_20370 [Steroidobacter sp.]|uniref:hypothetical protein n=1 Tax=Steroidobacter sp. TaxID=1978227 RepID=UPI002ED950B7